MNWKLHFRYLIIERGRYYYNRKRVRELTYENDTYKAKVVGEASYDVEIKIQGEEIASMKCSCPYASSGNKCKHMAAVLFAIEEKGKELKKNAVIKKDNSKRIRPFSVSKNDYQYFDMGKIAKEVEVTDSEYKDALAYIQKGKIILEKVELGYKSIYHAQDLSGIATGYFIDRNSRRPIYVEFNREQILRGQCYVSGCNGYYENVYQYSRKRICKHLLAVMLLLSEYLEKHNPGDSTDYDAIKLLERFRNQHVRDVIEKNTEQVNDFQILPIVEKEYNGVALSFKAGIDKLYVVKNLTELIEKYNAQQSVLFGTKTEIDLAKHRIAPSSAPIFQYVKQNVNDELERMKHSFPGTIGYSQDSDLHTIKNRMALFGERLDRFFELYEGQMIDCTDRSSGKSVKKKIKLCDGKPDIKLKIEKIVEEEHIFHGIHVTGEAPHFIKGNRYQYFFEESAFSRVDAETARAIQPLLEMSTEGGICFSVGRKHLSEFYHQILPVLKEYCTVIEEKPEVIYDYVPPKPTFAFYLDAGGGWITCRAKACYEEEQVSLLDALREDYVYEEFRNPSLEGEVLYQLHPLFEEADLEKDELCSEESEETVLQLLEERVEKLMALGEVHTTDRFRKLNVRKNMKMKLGVSVKSDIMNLSVSSDELEPEELLEILKNYERKKKYYRLKNGDFVKVNEADMDMLVQMMETLQVSPKEFVKGNMNVPAYRALYLNKMLEQGEDVYLNRDKNFKNMIKEFKTVDESEFEVPESLAGIMRGYQVKGFRWMKTLEQYGFGGILADDMGLGKTLQTISVLLSAKETEEEGTSLIVCPASLVYNWGEEFAKFAPVMKVTLVVGSQKERADIINNYKEADVLVTSYDLLRRDIAEYEECLFKYQILDEAQYIKNHTTAAAKTVKLIKSKQRYALTGTPIENRLSELWSIFDYLMPGFLYRYETFRKDMERKIVKQKDEEVSERLKKMVSPFILRRLKQDVLKDLPEKIEKVRYAKFEAEQQHLYDGQVVHMQNVLSSIAFESNKIAILAELTKIRQICCDPELLFEKYTGGSAKRDACMELIQSAMEGEHKILVFSQFTSMLQLLAQDLKEKEISYYTITGETPKDERVELVKTFNNDDTPVFLISLKAGGTGLNLTGADVVIHYDPWWNQAAQNQATDRAHRIGQNKVVSVYKLIAKGTIEEKIMKMQEEKKNLADSILSGDTGGITQMSKEELLELLGK